MENATEAKVGMGVKFKLMFSPNDTVSGVITEILPDNMGRKSKRYRIQPDKPIGKDQYAGTVFRYQPSGPNGIEVEDIVELFEISQ